MRGLMRYVAVGVLALGSAVVEASGDEGPNAEKSVEEFISLAQDMGIVILGEVHDNPTHHQNQARIVEALEPDALVFEMIPQEKEQRVNDLRAEGAARDAVRDELDWDASGWPDFDYYADIMESAPEARIFGAGQPPADIRRAMVEGAAGPFGPDAAIYGLDEALSAEELALRTEQMAEAHCHALPDEVLAGMVEAQRFRDAGLADATLWARTMTGGGQVVVITGNGHADLQLGMPKKLRIAAPEVDLISLGQLEAPPDGDEPLPFDYVLQAEAPDRGEPCEALRAN